MRNSRSGGIFVGPLTAESGVGTLLEALDLFPGARLEVVGDGPRRAPLSIRLHEHRQVRLLGELEGEDLQARIRSAAYLVLPSPMHNPMSDPMPKPLVEAFANGTPVIASRVGAVADLIEPGRNGLLFEAGAARELARRLAWAEAFPEKMRQMGECARADYQARFIPAFSYQTLFGERRRSARI